MEILEGAGRGARGLHSVHDHTDAVVDGERNRTLPGHADRHGGRDGEEREGFLLPGGFLTSDERESGSKKTGICKQIVLVMVEV